MAPNCGERGSGPHWGHPSLDRQPDPPQTSPSPTASPARSSAGHRHAGGRWFGRVPGYTRLLRHHSAAGPQERVGSPSAILNRLGMGRGFSSSPALHPSPESTVPHLQPPHSVGSLRAQPWPGTNPVSSRHRAAPLGTAPSPSSASRQSDATPATATLWGRIRARGLSSHSPTATHRQLLVVGHLVRQGPDPLIGTVHPQAGAEPCQLLVAPRVVPASAEEGMGTPSRTGHGHPQPLARIGSSYQWWWVVRTALSTTSSFLMISSN